MPCERCQDTLFVRVYTKPVGFRGRVRYEAISEETFKVLLGNGHDVRSQVSRCPKCRPKLKTTKKRAR